ncbi:hypothetical protein OIU74_021454, partial [Salix koriyanagi]
MWRTRSPDDSMSQTNGEPVHEHEAASRESELPEPVQSKPPEQMTIPKPEAPEKSEKSEEPAKPKKPPQVKRVSSAGLRTESVLKTKA